MTVHDTWFGNLLGTYETEDGWHCHHCHHGEDHLSW